MFSYDLTTGCYKRQKALVLCVVRHDRSHFSVESMRGDIRYRLSKAKRMLFGKQWILTDSISFDASAIILRSKPLSFLTSFEDEDGSTIAKMSQKCFSLGSQIQWGCSTYMWTGVRQLHLIDVKSGEIQAQLDTTWASKSCSQDQGRFVFYGSNHDSMWMRIVIASGLAESENVSRLGDRYPRLKG